MQVTVNDGHGTSGNLLLDELHPGVQVISGAPRHLGMMEGIDQGFEAACFIGCHARAGSGGILAHTYSEGVGSLFINDQEVGELGANALLAGYFGVPVVMVSGDNLVAKEAHKLLEKAEVAVVREVLASGAARHLPLRIARERIRKAVIRALERKDHVPLTPPRPVRLTVRFKEYQGALLASLLPGCKMLDSLTVTYKADDYLEAYKAIRLFALLAKKA